MKLKFYTRNVVDNVLLFLLALEVFLGVCGFSMLNQKFSKIIMIQEVVIILIFVLTLFFKKYTLEQAIVGFSIIIVSLLGWIFNGAPKNFLFMSLLIVAGSLLDSKKVIEITGVTSFVALAFVFILSKFNIIVNLTFIRDGIERNSFGMTYPLQFASIVLYGLIMLSMVYFKSRSNYKWAIALIIIALVLNRYTNARNNVLCLLGVAVLFCINFNKIPHIKEITNSSLIIVNVLALITVFITKIFPYGTDAFFKLDNFFSNRLKLQAILFDRYSPRLFGQDIFQVGYGGQTQVVRNYFYIDSSYTRIFFMAGIIFYILIMYISCRLVVTLSKLGLYRQAWLIMIILINAITENSFSCLGLNLLLPIMLCSETNLKQGLISVKNTNDKS